MIGALPFLIGLGLVIAVVSIQSGAFLANPADSEGNALQGGVLDLKLNESGPTNGEGSTTDEHNVDVTHHTWEDTAHDTLGSDNVSNTLTLDNAASTVDLTTVNVSVTVIENDSDANDGNAPNTSRTVEVTHFSYGGASLLGEELTDVNDNGRIDVDDLTLGSNAANLTSLSGVAAGGSTSITIRFSGAADLISGVGSTDGIDISFTIRGSGHGYVDDDRSINNTIRYG